MFFLIKELNKNNQIKKNKNQNQINSTKFLNIVIFKNLNSPFLKVISKNTKN